MTTESIGDIEAKFFIPGLGFVAELVEAKDHVLTPSEFWDEVRRFQGIDAGSPRTYRSFSLVSAGISPGLQPLINGLERVRGPYAFYENGSLIRDHSYTDFCAVVWRAGHSDEDARFLFERVAVEYDNQLARSHGEALFRQSLVENLPEYADLPNRAVGNIYTGLSAFIRQHRNQLIERREIEKQLRVFAGIGVPPLRPVMVFTSSDGQGARSNLLFDWSSFFGSDKRSYPPPEIWNSQLVHQLRVTREWISQNRATRRIRLEGNRRLSASLALGSVFSAVAGFVVEMNFRGSYWATDQHPRLCEDDYPVVSEFSQGLGADLVVAVGIMKSIKAGVNGAIEHYGLQGASMLHLVAEKPITSARQGNAVAQKLKSEIASVSSLARSQRIHLFLAAPSFLALFLGHRLNGLAPVQCYEWTALEGYVPTCSLLSGE